MKAKVFISILLCICVLGCARVADIIRPDAVQEIMDLTAAILAISEGESVTGTVFAVQYFLQEFYVVVHFTDRSPMTFVTYKKMNFHLGKVNTLTYVEKEGDYRPGIPNRFLLSVIAWDTGL